MRPYIPMFVLSQRAMKGMCKARPPFAIHLVFALAIRSREIHNKWPGNEARSHDMGDPGYDLIMFKQMGGGQCVLLPRVFAHMFKMVLTLFHPPRTKHSKGGEGKQNPKRQRRTGPGA